jgi:hypothetical protein
MTAASQVFEKNHLFPTQNRSTNTPMSENSRFRNQLLLVFIAAGLAIAILAPVAVLAASV